MTNFVSLEEVVKRILSLCRQTGKTITQALAYYLASTAYNSGNFF